jgi:hypothetical protein
MLSGEFRKRCAGCSVFAMRHLPPLIRGQDVFSPELGLDFFDAILARWVFEAGPAVAQDLPAGFTGYDRDADAWRAIVKIF